MPAGCDGSAIFWQFAVEFAVLGKGEQPPILKRRNNCQTHQPSVSSSILCPFSGRSPLIGRTVRHQ